jgi:adenine-specific DNA-methyltransferase
MRPDVGTQAQFKKKKAPVTYRYDSSLSPALDWDGQNPAREQGEAAIREVLEAKSLDEAKRAGEILKTLSKPFLSWAGKAERLSFDVPTLPLFVHERLSTKAIVETLGSHKRDKQLGMFELFGDPQHSVTDQILRAYEYQDKWVNRMILGDSLVVMNSLLQYEGLGGQVQMIYMDPPYGVKFGSNFQPFVRKRDVSHNDDEDMTREPEMVQAYRDTWELGLHSYLTYLRDRLVLARDLLTPSGSIVVQISDENLHHTRELLDEIFKSENFLSVITVRKTTSEGRTYLGTTADFLLLYAKDHERTKYRQLFAEKSEEAESRYDQVMLSGGTTRPALEGEMAGTEPLPSGARLFRVDNITSSRPAGEGDVREFDYEGQRFTPGAGTFKSDLSGLQRLGSAGRLHVSSKGKLNYRRFKDDFALAAVANLWTDISGAVQSRSDPKVYVVQTSTSIVQRCILMTTDPGDLVLDPTCGSGTTAYVAEQCGRRWITIDTSRVPLALARQRLLTATYPWYELKDEGRGPAAGFVYKRKQNNKGEEVGGIVPHVTLKSIANNEPPEEEVLVDRPETDSKITRVTGAFCVEGTIPTPVDLLGDPEKGVETTIPTGAGADRGFQIANLREDQTTYADRMLEILRKSPVLRLAGNNTVALRNIRTPAKTLSLSAEALVDANGRVAQGSSSSPAVGKPEERPQGQKADPALQQKPVALVFGPENGAVSERLVQEAAREASLKNYTHLYVIGFAVQPNARQLIENCDAVVGIPATYIQATPDLMMGDLLKNMRSSQIFSVCGLPEIVIHKVRDGGDADPRKPTAGAESQISDSRFEGEGRQAAGAESQIPDSGLQRAAQAGSQMADPGLQNGRYQVELLGLDVFDPVTMETHHRTGNDVPAWFLDTDYNGLCFHVSQAFFPRTSAWDNLKKALKGAYEESVWDHLSGTTSAPFEAGEHRQVAVKVIDDRGNELIVVEKL